MPFKEEAAKAAQEMREEDNIPYVKITVLGGVAEIAEIRGNVKVDIIDYDNH